MRTTIRKTWASGLAMIAVVAIGCGGGGGGSGSTSGSGTISGNISNQSAALHRKAPTTLLARLGRFFSPVTAALAEHSGIQVIVHNLETMTDQNGSFVITGTGSGTQTVTFTTGSGSFTLQVTVPPGAIVVLRDVELGSDGAARPGQIDVILRGTIAAASCSTTPQTLTVGLTNEQVTVQLGADTVIKGIGSVPASSCADLANDVGQNVRVQAVTQSDGSLLAERVKIRPNAGEPAEEIAFRGAVTATSCPNSITVQRGDGQAVTVNLTSSTEIDDAATCADLADQHVKVEGTLETDGSVTASEIEVSTEEERGDEGRRSFEGEGEGTPTPGATTTPSATATPTATPTP